MLNHNFRLATHDDLHNVLALYAAAIQAMQAGGIDQWDDLYPDAPTLQRDIAERWMHLAIVDGQIVAAIVLNDFQDDEYASGDWQCLAQPIATIHRLCVHPDFQRQGIARQLMIYAENRLRDQGYATIRLDAFTQNPKALKFYQSFGYLQAGMIHFRKGQFVLFEKTIT